MPVIVSDDPDWAKINVKYIQGVKMRERNIAGIDAQQFLEKEDDVDGEVQLQWTPLNTATLYSASHFNHTFWLIQNLYKV